MIIFQVKVHIATKTFTRLLQNCIIATFAVCNPVSLGRLETGAGENCADMEPELSGDMNTVDTGH